MNDPISRRAFMRLATVGGAVFASGLAGWTHAAPRNRASDDFYFVQLSDTHLGFSDPAINPDADRTLIKAVAAVNALPHAPDFVVFTGDLTHSTDDPLERRKRLTLFRDIAGQLKIKDVKFMPGEHDASLDKGKAFGEFFGATHYTFDHKGLHFIVLDNVSDPAAMIGDEQLQWLEADLARLDRHQPIVVLTHRPLFDLFPQWDWATRDGQKAIDLLARFENVTVFYGHIHQEHHHTTGRIAHHSAKSLMFPLPAPGSAPKRRPLPWDANAPYKGLGFREIDAEVKSKKFALEEHAIAKA